MSKGKRGVAEMFMLKMIYKLAMAGVACCFFVVSPSRAAEAKIIYENKKFLGKKFF